MTMRFPIIRTPEALVDLVEEIGFLPFFQHDIPGFSVEDCTPPEFWFTRGVETAPACPPVCGRCQGWKKARAAGLKRP